jgi:hypothetical protein
MIQHRNEISYQLTFLAEGENMGHICGGSFPTARDRSIEDTEENAAWLEL